MLIAYSISVELGGFYSSAQHAQYSLTWCLFHSQHGTDDGEEEQDNESPAHLAASTNNLPPKECSANLTDSTAELSPEEQVRPENKAAPAYSPLELPTRPAEDPAASNEGIFQNMHHIKDYCKFYGA